MQKRTFKIYRYDPDKDAKPYMHTVEIELDGAQRSSRYPGGAALRVGGVAETWLHDSTGSGGMGQPVHRPRTGDPEAHQPRPAAVLHRDMGAGKGDAEAGLSHPRPPRPSAGHRSRG